MYERFFDLRERPFELTSDPRFLYRSPRHREALANLEYGVSRGKPVTLLTGEPGTGKSTLLRAAARAEACRDVRWVYMGNPALTRDEFVTLLAGEFHLSDRAASSKGALLGELRRSLVERRADGELFALVIDEAQAMSLPLLEEVRLLGNLENETDRLLPIVLAGQPELATMLAQPALLPLRQRIALRCTVGPFDVVETASYIASRLRTAGGDASRVFTRDAVMLIHELAKGIARTINVMCDNALITGFALGRRPVDSAAVMEVAADHHIELPKRPEPEPAAAEESAGGRRAGLARFWRRGISSSSSSSLELTPRRPWV
jgi:type II secretory pathway predicted ATPase ExeA